MSEKKLSIFRPVFSKCNTRWGRWLWKNHSPTSDVIYDRLPYPRASIYRQIHTLIWFLGFGIAWGYKTNSEGDFYIQKKHVMKWDHCEYGCIASRIWIGRMVILT